MVFMRADVHQTDPPFRPHLIHGGVCVRYCPGHANTATHPHTHKSGTRKAYASICTQLLRKGLTTVKVHACVGTTTPPDGVRWSGCVFAVVRLAEHDPCVDVHCMARLRVEAPSHARVSIPVRRVAGAVDAAAAAGRGPVRERAGALRVHRVAGAVAPAEPEAVGCVHAPRALLHAGGPGPAPVACAPAVARAPSVPPAGAGVAAAGVHGCGVHGRWGTVDRRLGPRGQRGGRGRGVWRTVGGNQGTLEWVGAARGRCRERGVRCRSQGPFGPGWHRGWVWGLRRPGTSGSWPGGSAERGQ